MGWIEAAAAAAQAAGTPNIRRESTAARVRCRSRSEEANESAGELVGAVLPELFESAPETHDLHFMGPMGLLGDCCLMGDAETVDAVTTVLVGAAAALGVVTADEGECVAVNGADSNREQFFWMYFNKARDSLISQGVRAGGLNGRVGPMKGITGTVVGVAPVVG